MYAYFIGCKWVASPYFILKHIWVQFVYKYAETACKESSELYGDFATNQTY
jgi:hypothetical protein